MKYRLFHFLIFAAALTFGGCIETRILVMVKKDGSGTIRETVTMKKRTVDSIKEMAEQMKQTTDENGVESETEDKPFELFSEEEIRGNAEKLGTNVRYVSHELIDNDQGMGYVAEYAFDDINTARVNQDPSAAMPELAGGEGTLDSEDEFVLFSLTPGNPSTLTIRTPEMAEGGPEQGIEGEETVGQETENQEEEGDDEMEQMKEFFRDMRILVQVQVDGTIASTNASFVDGNTITLMDVNFNAFIDDSELLKQLQQIESKGSAAAKELFQTIPGLRMETEEEVTVTFN